MPVISIQLERGLTKPLPPAPGYQTKDVRR